VSVRSRVAFASGASGAVGAALLLTGRIDGSVVLAFFLAFAVRVGASAALSDAGPILAAVASKSLIRRAFLAPAWGFALAAAVVRAGSVDLTDVRGANAVAGLALVRGPTLTVVGSWLAFAAAAVATLAWQRVGAETAGSGSVGVIEAPMSLRRLEAAGVAAEVALLVSLFAGPQIDSASDAVWWFVGAGLLGAAALLGRHRADGLLSHRSLPLAAGTAGAVGLVLVLLGGAP